jgi:crossover junction endodeoxyribonuclease RuvC
MFTPEMKASHSNTKRILGIDPGTNLLGYALIEVKGKDHIRVLDYNVISLQKFDDHQTKLKEIYLQLQEVIETYLPEELAIEAPFFGKNVQSMLKLGRAQGVAIAAGITMGLFITEYSPKKVKQSVTGNGNASKEQVAAMLSNILNISTERMHFDATDALAVALCHHYQSCNGLQLPKTNSWKKFISENPGRIKTK